MIELKRWGANPCDPLSVFLLRESFFLIFFAIIFLNNFLEILKQKKAWILFF